MSYPKINLSNYTEFTALPQHHRFRILTMPHRYDAHMVTNHDGDALVCRCSAVEHGSVCTTCSSVRSDPRFVVLVRDQDTYGVCLWDIDGCTYNDLSIFHKHNKHFDIDFIMQEDEWLEHHTLVKYIVTPILSSSCVPEFYAAPDKWFDRYMGSIVLADDFGNKSGHMKWSR